MKYFNIGDFLIEIILIFVYNILYKVGAIVRKNFKLLTIGLFLFSSAVNAQSIDEAKKVNEEIIKNHNFEYKYVNPNKMIDKNYEWFQKNDYDGSTYSKELITHNFYEFMFREDLYNIVDFENVAGIDTACYF